MITKTFYCEILIHNLKGIVWKCISVVQRIEALKTATETFHYNSKNTFTVSQLESMKHSFKKLFK